MKKLLISLGFFLITLSAEQVSADRYQGCLPQRSTPDSAQWGNTDDYARNSSDCQKFCEAHFKEQANYNRKHVSVEFKNTECPPTNILCTCSYGYTAP